jgi:hypothetical protein
VLQELIEKFFDLLLVVSDMDIRHSR